MDDIKPEPLDFVKEFQEYLTQQTQHVNMISGAVCAEKDTDESFQVGATKSDQNGLDPPSVEVRLPLEDNTEVPMDNFERTPDGKYKCSYCNYANKGIARLVEHIRIHTGEKPHRCQLCPFASAYERHLEAHMRSHTGEKPYKCDLCGFCCSDRSNLSHHRRRRHKLLPMRGVRSSFTNKRMLSVLQKRTSSLGFNRRLLINFSPPSMVGQKSPYLNDFSHELHHHQLNGDECKNMAKAHDHGGISGRGPNGMMIDNPLNQLSTLAGQLANLHPGSQTPTSPDRTSCKDEKPIIIQQVTNGVQMSPPTEESHPSGHGDYGLGFEHSAHTMSSSVGNSQPSTPAHGSTTQDQKLVQKCHHCDIHYFDNILYTIHMGCHGYENPFQCNVCGCMCRDRYDFACHFARGDHQK